jgi:tRNA G18 (ribose-2'-O)-methylase SpoU
VTDVILNNVTNKPTCKKNPDYVVRIPMAHGVDSLNVAAAAAVAFWQLRV